jgi:hypothetical protein
MQFKNYQFLNNNNLLLLHILINIHPVSFVIIIIIENKFRIIQLLTDKANSQVVNLIYHFSILL